MPRAICIRSAHSCRNEVCDLSSASVNHEKEKKLGALCVICVQKQNSYPFHLTQRAQRAQSFAVNAGA